MAGPTTEVLRSASRTLRYQHDATLNEIEDIVVATLDRLAAEAITWGVDEDHDFYTDAAAATAIKKIADLLERAGANALRAVAMDAGADR